jgi:diacylglycerol kinase (ATP)
MFLARQAPEKYSVVVGAGGDGTLHEIVNGLLRSSGEHETIPIGLIPLGNGDDFAKDMPPQASIGGKCFDWRTAVERIVRGQTQCFDVGRMAADQLRPELGQGAHYFILAIAVGFIARAALNFTVMPTYLKGLSAYVAVTFKTMLEYPTPHLHIQLDDQPAFEKATSTVLISNARCIANGFWFCPQAQLDDGLLDLMITDQVSRLKILQMMPRFMRGTHLDDKVVHMYQARRVVLESLMPFLVETDGEFPFLETRRLEVDILPKKVCMIV